MYIVLLLVGAWGVSSGNTIKKYRGDAFISHNLTLYLQTRTVTDTTVIKTLKQKQLDLDNKKKIKEVAKAKRQPKPEKPAEAAQPATDATKPKEKPKRQRRPEGMERPPEIPRRNGN